MNTSKYFFISILILYIEASPLTDKSFAYWLFGADMHNVKLDSLSSQGVTDLFLNFYALKKNKEATVEAWISKAKQLGIRVHIWMQAFNKGKWLNPIDKDVTKNSIKEAKRYAKIPGVSGVHLDYLRYPGTAYKNKGGTEAINNYVKNVVNEIHKINPNCLVSAALMPEKTDSKHYYGQDYDVISKYMNIVVPMIYKGNYGKQSHWIKETTSWYVKNSKGAKVWSGLQSYRSDKDTHKLTSSQLTTDVKSALAGKPSGVAIFRWGITNYLNFKSL